ncbi:MAG: hypothetical protein H6873_11700 [Hyphomicrobiaceae bacterium]|nr:hypothetical protein [Hyphomicrobiaceae bacterium]
MTTFLVINSNDSGSGSLRQAILNAEESSNPGADTITFAPWLAGETIQLQSTLQIQSGKLSMSFDLDGDGLGDIILSGDNETQGVYTDATDIGLLIQVGTSANVSVTSLNAVGGGTNVPPGYRAIAGIQNYGVLNLADSYLGDLKAYGGGNYFYGGNAISGIVNRGTLTVSDTEFNELRAVGGGGGNLNLSGYTYGYDGGYAAVGIVNYAGGTTNLENLGIKNARLRGGDAGDGTERNGDGGDTFSGVLNLGGTVAGNLAVNVASNIPGDPGAGDGTAGSAGATFTNQGAGGVQVHPNSAIGTQNADTPSIGYADVFFGFGGNDRLIASSGLAYLYGGGGNDFLQADGIDVRMFGGTGDDVIKNTVLNSNAVMDGGTGIDLLDVSQDIWNFEFNMATGVAKTVNPLNSATFFDLSASNFENVNGTNQIDKITGTNGANIIVGNDGDDILKGQGGNDQILGGAGGDILRGGNNNDILRGGADMDHMYGDNGNDFLFGGADDDFLFGGNNNDRLRGGGGNDELDGGKGNDDLFGGDGLNTFIYKKGYRKDIARDFTDNTDLLAFHHNLWSGTLSIVQVLKQFAHISHGNAVFDFGHGDIFTVKGVTNLAVLKNDMTII